MQKRKIAYIVILSTVVIGCIWAFIAAGVITRNFKKEVLNDNTEKQELNIQNLVITETKDDQKYWELYAESGYYDNKNKVAILYDLVGNFYDEGKVIVSMQSTKGTFDETSKRVVLYEDTYIIYKDGTDATADRIVWEGRDEDIVAQGNVVISKKGEIRTFSDKAILANNQKRIKIIGRSKTELYSKGNMKNEKLF